MKHQPILEQLNKNVGHWQLVQTFAASEEAHSLRIALNASKLSRGFSRHEYKFTILPCGEGFALFGVRLELAKEMHKPLGLTPRDPDTTS